MQRTFTAESLDAKVHFQLLSLEKQLFVWADAGGGRLSALVLAGTSTPVSPLPFLSSSPFQAPYRIWGSAQPSSSAPACCRLLVYIAGWTGVQGQLPPTADIITGSSSDRSRSLARRLGTPRRW